MASARGEKVHPANHDVAGVMILQSRHLGHEAKVQHAESSVVLQEEVSRVWVRVEETIVQKLHQVGVQQRRLQVAGGNISYGV